MPHTSRKKRSGKPELGDYETHTEPVLPENPHPLGCLAVGALFFVSEAIAISAFGLGANTSSPDKAEIYNQVALLAGEFGFLVPAIYIAINKIRRK